MARWSNVETLVTLDDDGDAQPLLATAWSQVDPTTWRFEVRQGVRFHDGQPMTAAAVVGSLAAAAAAAPPPRILDGVDLSAEVDPSAPEGAVLVRTAQPDPLLPQRLSSPQLAVMSPAAYSTDAAGKTVVDPVRHATGPFVLTAVNGTSSATLDRFEGYWGEPAAAAGIDAAFVPDGTARAAALRTGTADVVEAVPAGQASLLDPALLHEVKMPRTNTLYLNTSRGAFADPAVRAAAREAVDARTIVDTVYEGRADVAQGLLGPALPWTADRPRRTPSVAPAGAADGKTITIGTFTDRAELPEVAVQLQAQLEAAGFTVRQDVRDYAQIEADALAGRFDAFVLSRATVLDSGDPVAYLASDFSCGGSFNLSQFCDAGVDAAIAEAAATPAGPERRAAVLEAERLVLEADAAVPLLHERVLQGEQPGVTGAVRDPRERALVTTGTRVGAAAA
ncbi:ABC transporter substrate-binding protein [Quadrisphaera oryzae]|uniref:ABC transporter substrate-binding protein n=1 Tax=Quadrisphaera TaxID=317661 RepID=UPI00351C1F8B